MSKNNNNKMNNKKAQDNIGLGRIHEIAKKSFSRFSSKKNSRPILA
jgi:hypothetical protein